MLSFMRALGEEIRILGQGAASHFSLQRLL